MAIAAEVLSGSLSGLSIKPGPGNLGRAAGAGFDQVGEQRQAQQQQQEAQATADFARQYQTAKANLQIRALAQSVGKQDLDAHNAFLNASAQQLAYINDVYPERKLLTAMWTSTQRRT